MDKVFTRYCLYTFQLESFDKGKQNSSKYTEVGVVSLLGPHSFVFVSSFGNLICMRAITLEYHNRRRVKVSSHPSSDNNLLKFIHFSY